MNGQRRELSVGERQRLGAPFDELDRQPARPLARDGEHLGALVDSDDRAAEAADELARDEPGAGRDVEHRVVRAHVEAGDEEAPPPRILAEREQRAVAVVRRAERREERARGQRPRGESILGPWRCRTTSQRRRSGRPRSRTRRRAGRRGARGRALQGRRVYLCAFAGDDARSWLLLDDELPVTSRELVRETVSLAALCEIVGEAVGDEPPRLATPGYLDEFGSPDDRRVGASRDRVLDGGGRGGVQGGAGRERPAGSSGVRRRARADRRAAARRIGRRASDAGGVRRADRAPPTTRGRTVSSSSSCATCRRRRARSRRRGGGRRASCSRSSARPSATAGCGSGAA